jgi:hypothetical protein
MDRRTDAAAGAALVVAVGTGYAMQHGFLRHRYDPLDPTIAWVREHAAHGQRIGLVGEWPSPEYSPALAMYGPRFQNRVSFVGPVRRGILGQYQDPAAFRRAVAGGRFDYMLVQDVPRAGGASVEERWLRAMRFTTVAESPHLRLLVAPPTLGS